MLQLPTMRASKRALSFLLLALSLLVQAPAWAVEFGIARPAALGSERQSYFERPDILQVKARKHLLMLRWKKWRQSHLEAAAAFLELYTTEHLYFLARDAELLYDAVRLISRDDPQTLSRLHLINVSRTNMGNEHLLEYLAQEGLTPDRLRTDPAFRPVFIDTGFNGSIPKQIAVKMPEDVRGRLRTHLLVSSDNSSMPSLRSFLFSANPSVSRHHPLRMVDDITDYENFARATYSSTAYQLIDQEWHPTSLAGPIDYQVNPTTARYYQEDLKHFLESVEGRDLLQERRRFWRELRQNWTTLSRDAWIESLRAILQTPPRPLRDSEQSWREALRALISTKHDSSARTEAAVRDFLEWARLIGSASHPHAPRVSAETLGLPSEGKNIPPPLSEQFPQWTSILESPDVQIPALLDSGDTQTLVEILDAIQHPRIVSIARNEIANRLQTESIYAMVQASIQNITNYYWLFNLFEYPKTAQHPELLRYALESTRPDTLWRFASDIFKQAHWRDHPQIEVFRHAVKIEDSTQRQTYLREQLGPYPWETDAPGVCEQQMLGSGT